MLSWLLNLLSPDTNSENKTKAVVLKTPITQFNIRNVVQVLECMYIFENTENPQTILDRADFFKEKLLAQEGKSDHVNQAGVDAYRKMYYDRQVLSYDQKMALIEPMSLYNDFKYLQAISIVNAFERYYNKEIKSLKKLKTETGKHNRLLKLKQSCRQWKSQLTGYFTANEISEPRIKKMFDFMDDLYNHLLSGQYS